MRRSPISHAGEQFQSPYPVSPVDRLVELAALLDSRQARGALDEQSRSSDIEILEELTSLIRSLESECDDAQRLAHNLLDEDSQGGAGMTDEEQGWIQEISSFQRWLEEDMPIALVRGFSELSERLQQMQSEDFFRTFESIDPNDISSSGTIAYSDLQIELDVIEDNPHIPAGSKKSDGTRDIKAVVGKRGMSQLEEIAQQALYLADMLDRRNEAHVKLLMLQEALQHKLSRAREIASDLQHAVGTNEDA